MREEKVWAGCVVNGGKCTKNDQNQMFRICSKKNHVYEDIPVAECRWKFRR